jgi:hypothetical protein
LWPSARRYNLLAGRGPLALHCSTWRIRTRHAPSAKGSTTMGMIQEFKEFAVKGNVIDLAVGVIIGGAFGKIVGSMVDDVIMPIVGSVVGKLDFSNLFLVLGSVPEGTAMTLMLNMV